MEKPCLSDPNQYPDDNVLSSYLGDAKKAWDAFTDFVKEQHPSYSSEWRYYNDGKNWLYKITQKKVTICWVAVFENMFKTSFYFGDKAEELITNSKLDLQFIDQFVNGKRFGKIRAVSVEITKPDNLETTKLLMEIKEKLK